MSNRGSGFVLGLCLFARRLHQQRGGRRLDHQRGGPADDVSSC